MRRAATLFAAATVAVGSTVFMASSAQADPSATDWQALRLCESGDNYSINTGNGYYGAYQFDLATWKSVGGTGRPDQASKAEQDFRALYLYRMRGWAPWICADLVGLKRDADAGSGRKPGTAGGSSGSTGNGGSTSGAPKYPGVIADGAYSAALKAWQNKATARGFGELDGTGWNGAKTKAAAVKVQRAYKLPANGVITQKTWEAVWKPAPSSSAPKPAPKPTPAPKPASMTPKAKYPGAQLKVGMTSKALGLWQKQMKVMGYGDFAGTGQFGEQTEQAVIELQRKAGLNVVGFIGPKTWDAAWNPKYRKASAAQATAPSGGSSSSGSYVPASNASCKVGTRKALPWGGTTMVRGKTYRDMQCFQRQLGHRGYGLTGTGFFGSGTAAAVAKFQSKYNLPRSGKVDAATWKAAWERY